jgi:glutathione peroxidase
MGAVKIFQGLGALDGAPLEGSAVQGRTVLVVNVASRCGLTPQYTGLERLQERYGERGFTVLGVPCNQFGQQEPGTPEEIATFCSTTYGVTFPMTEKVEVNGDNRHSLYQQLVDTADAEGHTGDIRWNFEKFLVSDDGTVIARFSPLIEPESDEVVGAIEKALAG